MITASPATRHLRLGALCAAWLSAGCEKQDTPACKPALEAVVKATTAKDFELARKLREPAYRECADRTELKRLDVAIKQGEESALVAKQFELQKSKEGAELLKVFMTFVADNHRAPERASAFRRCEAPAAAVQAVNAVVDVTAGAEAAAGAEAPAGGFCNASRRVGSRQVIGIRYWNGDPDAFRFSVTPEVALTCEALSGKVAKSWTVKVPGGSAVKRHRCELGGALEGLAAIVTESTSGSVHVIGPSYLERDPEARSKLDGS
jgi:hypothetical protein